MELQERCPGFSPIQALEIQPNPTALQDTHPLLLMFQGQGRANTLRIKKNIQYIKIGILNIQIGHWLRLISRSLRRIAWINDIYNSH